MHYNVWPIKPIGIPLCVIEKRIDGNATSWVQGLSGCKHLHFVSEGSFRVELN